MRNDVSKEISRFQLPSSGRRRLLLKVPNNLSTTANFFSYWRKSQEWSRNLICMAASMINHGQSFIKIKIHYYISKLVPALWLVNLVGRTLLHGPLKFKVVSVAKLLRDLSGQNFLPYLASKGLKLSFTLNCVQKRANELTTISNWLVLLSTCFRNLKKFLMNKIVPKPVRHKI